MTRRTSAAANQPALFPGGDDRGPAAVANAAAAKASTKTAPKPKAETITRAKQKADAVAKPAVNKGQLTVIKNTPTNTLAVLTKALAGKSAVNLQIVAALHKEMVAEQSRLDFIEAKRQMKRTLPIINRDGKIEYKDKGDGKGKPKPLFFATYTHLHDSIVGPLFDHGFDLTHAAQPGVPGMINVVTTLVHVNGHSEQSVLPMPHDASGGKSAAQGWASAFSFGKRVNTIGLLDIVTYATEDRDVDGNKVKLKKSGAPQTIDGDVVVESGDGHVGVATVEVCTEEQIIKVREAIEGCGVPEKTFLDHFRIKKVSQLPAVDFEDALAACRSYADRRKGK